MYLQSFVGKIFTDKWFIVRRLKLIKQIAKSWKSIEHWWTQYNHIRIKNLKNQTKRFRCINIYCVQERWKSMWTIFWASSALLRYDKCWIWQIISIYFKVNCEKRWIFSINILIMAHKFKNFHLCLHHFLYESMSSFCNSCSFHS